MAFNDIYKLVIHQRLHGQEVINKLHFVQELLGTGNLSQTLADDFRTNMDATLRARSSPDLQLEYVEAQRIVPWGDGPYLSMWPAGTFGTAPFNNSPSGMMAEVITIYTAGAGRRKRGRMYLSGLGSIAVANGLISSSQNVRTVNFANALSTRYLTMPRVGGFALGIWSRTNAGSTPPFSSDAFTIATAVTVRTTARTQRRRQIGVGR